MIPPVANNFVAGQSVDSALDHVEALNSRGVGGIVNLLGEHYTSYEDATADTEEYLELASEIADRNLDACFSVKPSQLGLDISTQLFENSFERIVDETECFVWIDMEDHTTTDATLAVFEEYSRRTDGNVGVCLQSNLVRTGEDLERLAGLPGKVRLVKGAYDEPAEIAFTDREKVTDIYCDQLEYMFQEFDGGIAVGSHDPVVIEEAQQLHDQYGTPYEIQMLMGVRERAQFDLVETSEAEVYQYVPYGSRWLSYFYRRLREHKSNIRFALRAIVGS